MAPMLRSCALRRCALALLVLAGCSERQIAGRDGSLTAPDAHADAAGADAAPPEDAAAGSDARLLPEDASPTPEDAAGADAALAREDAAPLPQDAAQADAGDAPDAGPNDAEPTPEPPGPRLTTLNASPPLQAVAGASYVGLSIQNPSGPCIVVSASNVRIADVELGPCGGAAAIVVEAGAAQVVIEHVAIHDSPRGVLVDHAGPVDVLASTFVDINGAAPQGTAIELDYVELGARVIGNRIRGSYNSDVISTFESSLVRLEGNDLDVVITEGSAAPFTLGDSVAPALPGHDNYAAYNLVSSVGGVPPGVFGSTGNTVLEHNCLRTGIQLRTYPPEAPAPFDGVTVRFNKIGPGSFTPASGQVAEWSTNIFTDGSAQSCEAL